MDISFHPKDVDCKYTLGSCPDKLSDAICANSKFILYDREIMDPLMNQGDQLDQAGIRVFRFTSKLEFRLYALAAHANRYDKATNPPKIL